MRSKHNSSASSSFSRVLVTADTSANQSNSVESQFLYTYPTQRRMEPGSRLAKSSSPPPGNLPRRRTRSPKYGPRVCERSDDEHSYRSNLRLSILSGSSNRFNNLNARQKSLVICNLLRWRSGTWREDALSSAWGTALPDSTRCWRLGLEERKDSNWDRVGMGESSILSDRLVRTAVCDFSESHDEILHIPERLRRLNFGRLYRMKKRETSTAW